MPELNDEQLTRLLRSIEAAPGDAAWARALARIEAQETAPRWLAWAIRPAALAAAAGLLICAAGACVWIAGGRADSTTLAQQVLAAGGASESTDLGVTINSSAAGDSGTLQ